MKLAIAGASGRMGQMLIEAALASQDLELAVALDRSGSPALGRDAGEFMGRVTGVKVSDDLGALAAAEIISHIGARPDVNLKTLAGNEGLL